MSYDMSEQPQSNPPQDIYEVKVDFIPTAPLPVAISGLDANEREVCKMAPPTCGGVLIQLADLPEGVTAILVEAAND